jgi:ParB/RepB/Spo0J family partition protein
MAKPALGRGLGALLGGSLVAKPPVPAAVPHPAQDAPNDFGTEPREHVQRVPLGRIVPCPFQPRKDFSPETLRELADSIKAQGIVQPLIVRDRDGHLELIAGERRWRAAQLLGLAEVPVILRQADDRAVLELALIENLQRENLNPIEEAQGYSQLVEQFQLTQEEVAAKVGKSRAVVANALRLLKLAQDDRDLPEPEQLRGPPAAFAGDEFQVTVAFTDDERLNNALFLDRVGQFAESLRGKVFAGLKRTGLNAIERNTLHVLARIDRRSGFRDCG